MALSLISRVRASVRDLGLGLGLQKEGLKVRAGSARVFFKKGITRISWSSMVSVWFSEGFDASVPGVGIQFKEDFCVCENGWK